MSTTSIPQWLSCRRTRTYAVALLLLLGSLVTTLSLHAQSRWILGGDAVPDIFLSPENAVQPTRVIDGASGADLGAGFPFGPFGGGNRIAAGDLNGDGVADIVAGMGPGGSFVQLFDGATIANLGGGFPFGPFGGGVFLAVGDLNGDGRNDIAVSQGPGGGLVRVFNGIDYSLLLNLAPFGGSYAGGVSVAMGDLNGDGRSDLIVGQLTGGVVSIIDGATQGTIVSGAPFGGHQGGIHVAAGDVNGDGRADIILAPARQGGVVVVYDLGTVSQIGSFFPYGGSFTAGVRVAAADVTGDGRADIITGPGPGGGNEARVFSGNGFGQVRSIPAYAAGYNNGVFVAASTSSGLRFTSAAATTFTVGQAGSFSVTTAGSPPASSITVTGTLPPGVTFTYNGNGTATLSGTPTGNGGAFPLTFTATGGGRPPVTQNFTLTVNQAPAITSANAFTFNLNIARTFTITTTGFPTPTVSVSGTLPNGVTFAPGANGTGILSGTATGPGGAFPLTVTASNGVGTAATQNLVLTVDSSPAFTSAATTTFTVGQAGTFTITTVATPAVTNITRSGTLPAGVTFTYNNNGTATLAGTPAAATGGSYPLVFTAVNGTTPATQNFTLVVDQPPDAVNDTFSNGVGNTQYVVGGTAPATPAVTVAGSVLGNDIGTGTLTAGPASIVSTQGGQVAMASTGAFVYTPPAGFAGPSDTFTYTLTDAQNRTDTATVTINLSGIVWYVGQSGVNGDGRSATPFNSLAAAQAGSTAGQTIYVSAGTFAGSVALRANEVLRGSGAAFSLNGLTIPATTSPLITGTLTLANGVQVSGVSVNGGAGTAVVGSGITGTTTLTSVAITGGATGFLANGGSGTQNIGATITTAGGRPVDVQNLTAGTVTFSGLITDTSGTGTGVLLNANTGATIAFTGGMNVVTGAADAFTATGGGTVTATQNNTTIVNTLSSSAGTGLFVANTQIGAAGMTFRSVSAGTTSSSSGAGIVVDTTGAVGRLIVTGTGAAGSGGTIIRKTGANGLTTQGVGIYARSTQNPSFSSMQITEATNAGLLAHQVSGLEFINGDINGAGDTAGEGSIQLGQPNPGGINGLVTGTTAIIRNSRMNGGFGFNVGVYQQSGTATVQLDRTTPTPGDCLVGYSSGTAGLHVLLEGVGTAATVNVDQCRLRDNSGANVLARSTGSANLTLTVNGSEVVNGGDGIVLTNEADGQMNATVSGNTISGFAASGVRIAPNNATSASRLRTTISSNNFGGSTGATDASIVGQFSSGVGQSPQARIIIADNGAPILGSPRYFTQDGPNPGVRIALTSGTPLVNLSVTDNHVDMNDPNTSTVAGVRGAFGIDLQGQAGTLCAAVGGQPTGGNLTHWYPTTVTAIGSVTNTLPDPGTIGLSLTLQTGQGALMPTSLPFYAVVGNTETVLVTGVSGDTLTIVRAQEGTVARNIVAGDEVRVLGGRLRLQQSATGTVNLEGVGTAAAVLAANNATHPAGASETIALGTIGMAASCPVTPFP